MRATSIRGAAPILGQRAVVSVGLATFALGTLWLGAGGLAAGGLGAGGWRLAALFLLGGGLGISLYHAAFGFTAAYRNAILHRDVAGVRAQLVMIALAMLLFAPILAAGELFGRPIGGALAPVGLRVAIGAFLFGLGMQLGGGCGSGTLFTVGGGSIRMLVALVAFCAGAFLGSLDGGGAFDAWTLGTVSLGRELGFFPALVAQLALLAAIWLGLSAWAGDRPQRRLWDWDGGLDRRRLLAGPWPLLLAAVLLAAGNLATLLIAGHAWSITWGFTLWAAEAARALGWDPASSPFWASGFGARALDRGVLADTTSIMNLGIMLGALVAAGLASRFAPTFRIAPLSLLAAVLGGLAMGYGARLAFGCNIGAFFSGVASFSLHGWLWIAFALLGTWPGIHLRPWFGLPN